VTFRVCRLLPQRSFNDQQRKPLLNDLEKTIENDQAFLHGVLKIANSIVLRAQQDGGFHFDCAHADRVQNHVLAWLLQRR
jgi:hypothetical protein